MIETITFHFSAYPNQTSARRTDMTVRIRDDGTKTWVDLSDEAYEIAHDRAVRRFGKNAEILSN